MATAITSAALALASSALAASSGSRPAVGCPLALEDALPFVQVHVDEKLAVQETAPVDCSTYESSTYAESCSADTSLSQGYCTFVTGTEPMSCNDFCFRNGKRTCVAGANSKRGCEWKSGDEGAGTAAFCDKVISANVCACSDDVLATAPEARVAPTTPVNPPLITGDPHVTNVEGKRFSLARAGVHELLRLPRGPASRPGRHGAGDVLLQVLGTVESERPCAEPLVRQLDVSGLWLRKTGPLVLRAGGQKMDGADAVVMEVNGSRVGRDGLARDEGLPGLLRVSEPEVAGQHAHDGRIRRDMFLTATLRLPGATLQVDWIHRELPGSSLNHLDLHVADLPKIAEGMDVGGILGRDNHTLAASPTPGCTPSQTLLSIGTGAEVLTSQLGASYKYK